MAHLGLDLPGDKRFTSAFLALGARLADATAGWRDGTVLGSTASTCGRAPVQSFRHGARALNLEACPELRMDAIGAIEDDAAIAATRPTSKLGGCVGSVSSLVTAQWCWWPLARPFWVGCHLASHRPCHADSQHGCCERAQTPGSVSGGVPGRGLDPQGRAAHASALLRSESLRPCISGPHRPS